MTYMNGTNNHKNIDVNNAFFYTIDNKVYYKLYDDHYFKKQSKFHILYS